MAQILASAQRQTASPAGLRPSGAANGVLAVGAEDLMHATAHRRPFTAAGWTFEMKLDGLRVLARRTDDRVHLLCRRGRSLAPEFPELVELLQQVRGDWVLDGAIVLPDMRRHSERAMLRRRTAMKLEPMLAMTRDKACLCLFDVLVKDGQDLRALPLTERQVSLSALVLPEPGLRIVSSLESHGNALFDQAVAADFDGIVAKRLNSPYLAGRQETWLKIRNPSRAPRRALRWFRTAWV